MGETIGKENVQILVPLIGVGGGEAIDEVDADVLEASLFGPVEALLGMMRVVATAQILQVVVEKALDADAEAVDPELAQTFEVFQRQRVGIGLKGDFGIRRDRIMRINMVQQLSDFL